MTLIVTHHDDTDLRKGESEFEIRDGYAEEEGFYQAVRIHPWHRTYYTGGKDSSVFVSVGNYTGDGVEDRRGDEEPVWNIIVNREDFVEGILETFPELKRA